MRGQVGQVGKLTIGSAEGKWQVGNGKWARKFQPAHLPNKIHFKKPRLLLFPLPGSVALL